MMNVQGNILRSHGRKYTRLVLFWFDSDQPDQDRRKLFKSALHHNLITSAYDQYIHARGKEHDPCRPFYSLGLTLKGLQRCGYDKENFSLPIDPATGIDRGFGASMTETAKVDLDNPPTQDISGWDPVYRLGKGPDGVWLLAHERKSGENSLETMEKTVVAILASHQAKRTATEDGFAWKDTNGHRREPFGFRDSISSPEFIDSTAYRDMSPWVRISRKQVLFDFPPPNQGQEIKKTNPDLQLHNGGSFLVLRKLEQNVCAFRKFEAIIQKATGDSSPGSLLVGRDRNGMPRAKPAPETVDLAKAPNRFEFDNNDSRCPYHAHIRKANPRMNRGDMGALFVRRSMVYDTFNQLPERLPPDEAGTYKNHFGEEIEGGVGLLFMGYMSSIDTQFIRMQQQWFGTANFPVGGTNFGDALIRPLAYSGAEGIKWVWPIPSPGQESFQADPIPASKPQPVMSRGGAYFYIPPLAWLAAQ